MRYALIGDIHANLHALNAVIADIRTHKVDQILCLGDVVGYGAQPVECIELVRSNAAHSVAGNHDLAAVDDSAEGFNEYARTAILWTRDVLSDSDKAWLTSLPMLVHLADFTIVHSSLDDPRSFPYINSISTASRCLAVVEKPVCFFAHTHIPAAFHYSELDDDVIQYNVVSQKVIQISGRMLINGGSVGQPRNRDPRAAYCIYDSDHQDVCYRQVDYDIQAAMSKIREAGLPELLAYRLELGV